MIRIKALVVALLVLPLAGSAQKVANPTGLKIELKEVLTFGTEEDALFDFVTALTTDDDGFIYATDSMDCSLKKFDRHGKLLAKTGRKGQGPGEFQFPVLVEGWAGHICVVDQNLPGISVFGPNLQYQTRIPFETPIFDLRSTADGRLLVLSPGLAQFPPIVEVGLKGTIGPKRAPSADPLSDFWKRTCRFETDKSGNVFLCHSFEDSVARYDKAMRLVWEKGLLGRPKVGTSDVKLKGQSFALPKDVVFKDIAIDSKGLLFILGGHLSEHRSRDVYVIDESGKKLTTIVLPEPTYAIHIDRDDYLFIAAGEGTGIKKYQLIYR